MPGMKSKMRMVPGMMAKKGKEVYKPGGERSSKKSKDSMTGLKAMFRSLSDSQKEQLMQAKYGKEKLLMQMGGGIDMAKPMEMRYGGDSMTEMRYGGGTASTYSGKSSKKKSKKRRKK